MFTKKPQLFTSNFQFKLMEHLTLWGLCGLLIISTRFSSENQALESYIFYPLTKRIHVAQNATALKRNQRVKGTLSTYLIILYYSVKFYKTNFTIMFLNKPVVIIDILKYKRYNDYICAYIGD